MTDPAVPTAQQRRAELVRRHLVPALRAEGLSRDGSRTWYERRPDGGWVLMTLRSSKWSTQERVEVWLDAVCWPEGTWEFRRTFDGRDDSLPFVAANAPLSRVSQEWPLGAATDLDVVGADVVAAAAAALEWGRGLCADRDTAVTALTSPETTWGLIDAIALLEHVDASDPRFAVLVERLTSRWAADPRPVWLRATLLTWRDLAGLPSRDDLPTYWAPCMQSHAVERYGSAQAAWRAGFGTVFTYADGTDSDVPPQGWLEQAPSATLRNSGEPAPGRPRRRWRPGR